MTDKNIKIQKASGEHVDFDESKLRYSLERSGANEALVSQVIDEISRSLYEGISTKEIYKKAFSLLRKSSRAKAARYKLKKAIYELGPTGFPFERFVGKILEFEGFKTQVGEIVKGHCVSHEVDVIAEKEKKRYMVECKFHSDQGRNCDVKIPLYIHSRVLDLEKQWQKHPENDAGILQGWIFTNTRFTADAIRYGNCVGLKLVGWDYPKMGSIKERIDISGLHPITCLTTLTKYEKEKLLEREIVLCREIFQRPSILDEIAIPVQRHRRILNEANDLSNF